jgi:hypothetical protein
VLTSVALLLGACGGGDAAEVAGAGAGAAPAAPVLPVSPPPPQPAAPAEPAPPPVIERMVRTLPGVDWDPDQPMRNTAFGPFDTDRHRVAGQTLEVTEAFVLHRVGVTFEQPTIALPGFRDIYFDGIDWGRVVPYVDIPPPTDDLAATLSIILYRSPSSEAFPTVARMSPGAQNAPSRVRDVIPVASLEVVTEQRLTGKVRTDRMSLLDLTEPLVMEPGLWLVAFRLEDTEGGVDLIGLPIVGFESGTLLDVVIPPDLDCEFIPKPDPTPGYAFYTRTVLSDGLEAFTPGFGKVQDGCVVEGYYFSPAAPGDIGLDLWGFPLG